MSGRGAFSGACSGEKAVMTALVWFRNDLRLADNPALAAAMAGGRKILCVFLLDSEDEGIRAPGAASRWRLDLSLRALDEELSRRGGALHVLRGAADELLPRLVEASGASAIFWNRRYRGGEIVQDKRLKELFRSQGMQVESFNGALLAEPWQVKTGSGGAFKVFTPFWRALREKFERAPPGPAPKKIAFADWPPEAPPRVDGKTLGLAPERPNWAQDFPEADPGESGARKRLRNFLSDKLDGYATLRDRTDEHATSNLSAHLHFGEISPREIFAAASGMKNSDKFLSELGWREFCHHLLFAFPDLPSRNFQARFDAFPWLEDEAALKAWRRGLTGYPLVDAGMRELWRTGCMHNRVRMVTASFLTKHLLIDWRAGEAWFWDTLVDADAANNVANWQWVAGCGADAAPYFRIFNPVLQGEKFDPDGAYVRRYCPELAELPNRYIHRPWTAPAAALAEAKVRLGETYPKPIIDHDFARRRALAAFASL